MRLLVEVWVPEGPLVLDIDQTLQRRWRKKITAKGVYSKGVYHNPVRSNHENLLKARADYSECARC